MCVMSTAVEICIFSHIIVQELDKSIVTPWLKMVSVYLSAVVCESVKLPTVKHHFNDFCEWIVDFRWE